MPVIEDLVHDTGACLLGGKILPDDYATQIRAHTFLSHAHKPSGEVFTIEDLTNARILEKDTEVIEISDLLDARVFGTIEYEITP